MQEKSKKHLHTLFDFIFFFKFHNFVKKDIFNNKFFENEKSLTAALKTITVMTLSFRTDRSGQTVQTQIRLLLEEQSDQGLHWLLFHLYHFDKIRFRFGLFVSILARLQQRFLASQNLGTLR